MRTYNLTHTDSDGNKTSFVIEAANFSEAIAIYRERLVEAGNCNQGFQFRTEGKGFIDRCIEERLDAKMVAGDEQVMGLFTVYRKGEHSYEMIQTTGTEMMVHFEYYFRIRGTFELCLLLLYQ